ncbi:MAG: hypothetical protein EOP86_18775 [Verrucomicrobiaceae bacterium]|nr:MAG: hypothetical protein EOP86_18775 [Verrucomicrobiaceae bacterium]
MRAATLSDGWVEMHFIVKVPPLRAISSARTFEKDAQAATQALTEYGLVAFNTGGEPFKVRSAGGDL